MLLNSPQWPQTLLVITYDEHGGCYDHVPPPSGATPPDDSPGEFGFDLTRFGVRVPTVLVSPMIPAGTVFSAAPGSTPFDHTSILAAARQLWGISSLTARDAAAPSFLSVASLASPRTDDPLSGVVVPVASEPPGASVQQVARISHLDRVHARRMIAKFGRTVVGGVPRTSGGIDRMRRRADRAEMGR